MKHTITFGILIAALLLAATGYADDINLKIRRIDVDKDVYTPLYRADTEQDNDPGPSQRWLRLAVEYTTEHEWIDEVTVRHMALVPGHDGKEPIILATEVTYMNIGPGSHLSYVYMHPNCVKRYDSQEGEIDSAVEILIDGKRVAFEATTTHNSMPDWYKNPKLVVQEGHLLNDSETPFWFINYDYKEMIKHDGHSSHRNQ